MASPRNVSELYRCRSPVNVGIGVADDEENAGLIASLHERRLNNMMKMSENALPHPEFIQAVLGGGHIESLQNRSNAIIWIKECVTTAQMSADARDSSIQIFDKFLSNSWVESDKVLFDTHFICFAACSSLLISAKLHEGSQVLTMANFPLFPTADLIEFERRLLTEIGYSITALSTPSAFVRHLLGLCPEYEDRHIELIDQADIYIAEFSEQNDYVLFAPSTVAVSALLIAFSTLEIYATVFSRRIPSSMLPQRCQENQANCLLDIDKCLSSFQRTSSVSEGLRRNNSKMELIYGKLPSPTSVSSYALSERSESQSGSSSGSDSMHVAGLERERDLQHLSRQRQQQDVGILDLDAIEGDSYNDYKVVKPVALSLQAAKNA